MTAITGARSTPDIVQRRLWPLLCAGVAAAAGIAAVAGVAAWQIGASATMAAFAAAALLMFQRSRARSRRQLADEEQGRRARRESAVRILWAASGDFLTAGWGRNDLEKLRLLALNIQPDRTIGPRVAERVREAVSAVLSGVLDRLGDVVVTAREVELEPTLVARLEASVRVLAAELDGQTVRAGETVPFRPGAVVAAATQAVNSCAALRDALRPYMVSDLVAIVHWVTERRNRPRMESGELIVDLSGLPARTRVAARPLDLARALDDALQRVFARGQVAGPVRLSCTPDENDIALTLAWAVRDPLRLDARVLTEPLRVLSSYGARLALKEQEGEGTVRLETVLPAASAGAGTPVRHADVS